MIPSVIRDDLADLLTVAAVAAREGDTIVAMVVKRARDNIAQYVCDHREGTGDHLSMAGSITSCRACGKRDPYE